MTRISRIVLALGLILSALLVGGTAPSTAATGYGASFATRLTIDIKTDCCFGLPAAVVINVTSDAKARPGAPRGGAFRAAGDFTGTARVLLDGKVIKQVPVGPDGKANLEIPFNVLTVGSHIIAADYTPAPDSVYQGASTSRAFNVVHCVDGTLPDTGSHNGGLPTTGGPWIGIIALAVLLLLAGGWLMRRKGSTR